jgi:quinol monooxygenase YgiN
VHFFVNVVQILVRLVAPGKGAPDVLQALRSVMRPAQQFRGCRFAQIYLRADDDRCVEYVEEWDSAEELRGQLGSDRFARLLEVLETSAERPVLEFRVISETHGLEYIKSATSRPSLSRRK